MTINKPDAQYQFLQSTFVQLSKENLYAILKLRQQVFLLEQQSLYADIDELDKNAQHFYILHKEVLVGYARLRFVAEQGIYKLERVVIDKGQRRKGLADGLMRKIFEHIQVTTDEQARAIKLSSQTSVLAFYRKWGFVEYGQAYDDAGVEHIDMLKSL